MINYAGENVNADWAGYDCYQPGRGFLKLDITICDIQNQA